MRQRNLLPAELKKDLDEVANFKGSRLEQWLLIYCKQNRIPYNRFNGRGKAEFDTDRLQIGYL